MENVENTPLLDTRPLSRISLSQVSERVRQFANEEENVSSLSGSQTGDSERLASLTLKITEEFNRLLSPSQKSTTAGRSSSVHTVALPERENSEQSEVGMEIDLGEEEQVEKPEVQGNKDEECVEEVELDQVQGQNNAEDELQDEKKMRDNANKIIEFWVSNGDIQVQDSEHGALVQFVNSGHFELDLARVFLQGYRSHTQNTLRMMTDYMKEVRSTHMIFSAKVLEMDKNQRGFILDVHSMLDHFGTMVKLLIDEFKISDKLAEVVREKAEREKEKNNVKGKGKEPKLMADAMKRTGGVAIPEKDRLSASTTALPPEPKTPEIIQIRVEDINQHINSLSSISGPKPRTIEQKKIGIKEIVTAASVRADDAILQAIDEEKLLIELSSLGVNTPEELLKFSSNPRNKKTLKAVIVKHMAF